MAARRLLILLLVLLGISMLATALAPVRDDREETSSETTTAETTGTGTTASVPDEAANAGLFNVTIKADPSSITKVRLYAGEELQLKVESTLYDQVAIPELGQIQAVSPYGPAMFDLLLDQPGDYAVRLVTADSKIAELNVSPGARPEKDRKKANARP